MKRPLLPVALLFACGVLLGERVTAGLPVLFAAGLVTGIAALLWKSARPYLLCALVLLTGWADMSSRTTVISPNDLRNILQQGTADVKIRGEVCAAPTERIFERGAKEFWHTAALIQVAQIWRGEEWQAATGKIIAGASGVLGTNFFAGRNVEVSGIIHPPHRALAEGLFDPAAYYQRQEVYYQLQTDSTNAWQALGSSEISPVSEQFLAWARRTLALGLPEEDEALRLMWTLALDWKAPLTQSVEDPFLRAGTYHIFAVDGLRIGLLTWIGMAMLRALRLPRGLCGMLVIPAIWFYAGLTGWPASAVRAAIMMTVVIAGWSLKRPGDLVNSLFTSALIILVCDPQQLFLAGFQLSFVIVFCLALLVPPLQRFFHERFFAPDPLLPDELRPRWHKWAEALRRWGIDLLVMSLAAFLASVPLAAYYFHLCSPVGISANFVVVPLTGLALMSAMGSLLTGGWFPAVAILFNHAGWFWMKCIIAASQWSAEWHLGNWYVSAPRPMTFVWYYAVLLMVGTGWIFRIKHKRWAIGFLLVTSLVCVADWLNQRGLNRVDILALRGAPSVFVGASSTNRTFLADCGDTNSAEGIVKPFLHAQGVNRLDDFCLTAGYQQSIGGAEIILTNFAPTRVEAGPARVLSPAYRRVMATLERIPGLLQTVQDGKGVAGWSVLYPSADDKFRAADEVSLALHRDIAGHGILLLSALGRDGQNLLMARHPDLRAEIVVAGLPSRDEPLDEPLLDLLQPKLIIVADSEQPATRRASARLRERLAQRPGVHVFYLHECGSLTLLIRQSGWEIDTADHAKLLHSE